MLKNNMFKVYSTKMQKLTKPKSNKFRLHQQTVDKEPLQVCPCSMLYAHLKAYQYVQPVNNTTHGVFSSNSEHGILLVWILKEPRRRLENPSDLVSCHDYKQTDRMISSPQTNLP